MRDYADKAVVLDGVKQLSLLESAAYLVESSSDSNGEEELLVNEECIELPLDSALARGFLPFIEDEPTLAGTQARTLVRT